MSEKYDVFISFKNTDPKGGLTVDRTIAQRLHDKLLDEGLNVFFSEKDLSDTAFVDEIFTALDQAELLILVGTSVEYVTSRWVKSEWSHFFGAMNSGKKQEGRIMTVLHGIVPNDLPLPLSNFQSFNAEKLDEAVAYAFRTLGRISNTQARKWEKAENERKLREAEEERLKAIKAQMEAERRERAEKEAAEKAQKKAAAAAEKAAAEEQKRLAAEDKAKQAVRLDKKIIIITFAVGVLAALIGIAAKLGLFRSEWEYTVSEDGTASITSYNGDKRDIRIPQELNGNSVTSIGYSAFFGCSLLTSVTIPDSVTSIGDHAFEGCSSLTSVTIPDSVTSIGYSAFFGCSSLTSVNIPDGVDSIWDYTFSDCSSLTSVTIPDSVTFIGYSAFFGCSGLTSVALGSSLTYIGGWAFSGCSGLTSVTIPDSVWKIDRNAFSGCSSLTSVNIPDGVDSIWDYTFSDCSSLTSVTIPDSVTSIGDYAFGKCSSLTSVTIDNGVTFIGDYAFWYCDNLTVYAPHNAGYYGSNLGDCKEWIVL